MRIATAAVVITLGTFLAGVFPEAAALQDAGDLTPEAARVEAWWHVSAFQFKEAKDLLSSLEETDEKELETYVTLCSWCLARAHACAGDALQTGAYLGKSDTFAKAIGRFAIAYADQTEADHEALGEAVRSGRITAERGV